MQKNESGYFIRPASFADARAIYLMIRDNTDNLIPRSIGNIVQHLDRFMVAESDDGQVIGTAAFAILPEIGDPGRTTIEIQSVCVVETFRRRGTGRALVVEQIRRVLPLDPAQIIVLTFTPEFFAGLGFVEVPKASLMHKIYMGCINCTKHESPFTCPEVAMALNPAGMQSIIKNA